MLRRQFAGLAFPGSRGRRVAGRPGPGPAAADKVERLSDAVVKVVKDPAMQEKFRAAGAIPPAEFAGFLKSEDQRWSEVIAGSNIKTD